MKKKNHDDLILAQSLPLWPSDVVVQGRLCGRAMSTHRDEDNAGECSIFATHEAPQRDSGVTYKMTFMLL